MDGLRIAFATLNKRENDDKNERKELVAKAKAKETTINAGLWLDKYLSQQDVKQAESSIDKPQETSSRTSLVQEVASIAVPESYGKFYEHWLCELHNYYQANLRVARAKGRMIVGLGEESVIETAIALHHTYGVPYIPGSSLKGLTATYLRQQIALIKEQKDLTEDQKQQKEKEYQQAQQVIFGQTEDAGYVTFCDALYIPGSVIKGAEEADCPLHQDIITVHHQQYYQGNAAPTDYESPIPVPFLSATGSYLVALAAPDLQEEFRQPWIDVTYKLLELALEHNGIGAKTSSGYGRMKLEQPVDQTALKIESYINEVKALPDNSSIAGRIPAYYRYWSQVKTHKKSKEFAQVIINKVNGANINKTAHKNPQYQEILQSIQE